MLSRKIKLNLATEADARFAMICHKCQSAEVHILSQNEVYGDNVFFTTASPY